MPGDTSPQSSDDDLIPVTGEGDEESLTSANDVFVRYGDRLVLYSTRRRGPLSTERWQRLLESRRQEVYVKKMDLAESLRRLSDEVARVLADTGTSTEEKYVNLYTTTAVAMSEVFKSRLTDPGLDALTDYVACTASFVTTSPSAVVSLQHLMAHDYTTYAHCASVYIHAIALAASMRPLGEEMLRQLGLGAILHDIGKTRISADILQKPGPLSDEEWKQMKRHPQFGVKMLRELTHVPLLAQTITAQHHERCDGSGYPLGLTRSQINPLTHIVIVADMYDALTKARTFRPAHSLFEALQIMKDEAPKRINAEAYRALVLLLASQ